MRHLVGYFDDLVSFSKEDIHAVPDLWAERSALFLTATAAIPDKWIGEGELHVTLPICPPISDDIRLQPALMNTRFWVELFQRATGKLRWRPMNPVVIGITRYDTVEEGEYRAMPGAKALIDALKVASYGRPDGSQIHYFGAITDDSSRHIRKWVYKDVIVDHPREARVDVHVTEWQEQRA